MTVGRPPLVRVLPGGAWQREPWPEEKKFFRTHPHVAGMAAEDNAVVLNPYTKLSEQQRDAVLLNEAARVFMRIHGRRPTFGLTGEQVARFENYGSEQDIRETIAARLLSGDPSAGPATNEQSDFVRELRRWMDIP